VSATRLVTRAQPSIISLGTVDASVCGAGANDPISG
jgi:hypothetical protein